MKFYKGVNGGFEEIDNYGLYDYLKLTNEGITYKLMASIFDNDYAVIYDRASNNSHNDLSKIIINDFGDEDKFYIAAINKEFHICMVDDLSVDNVWTLIEILEEIKSYCLKNKESVTLKFYSFEQFQEDEYDASRIDGIIKVLETMKDVRTIK